MMNFERDLYVRCFNDVNIFQFCLNILPLTVLNCPKVQSSCERTTAIPGFFGDKCSVAGFLHLHMKST